MSPSLSIAANLSPIVRQRLAIEVLAMKKPVSDLAAEHQVSRKFVYGQVNKAENVRLGGWAGLGRLERRSYEGREIPPRNSPEPKAKGSKKIK